MKGMDHLETHEGGSLTLRWESLGVPPLRSIGCRLYVWMSIENIIE